MCTHSPNTAISKPPIRIADLLDTHWKAYLGHPQRQLFLEDKHHAAARSIQVCRTAKMGQHLLVCKGCGVVKLLNRSCKHRFCPTCGGVETQQWANKLLGKLLNIKHHHVVVTLPALLRPLARVNQNIVFSILFKSAAEAIQNWFGFKHQLKCGIVSVLHSAGSDLKYHPHVHMIVSAGGLDSTGGLKALPRNFLVNHQHLSRRFRWLFENKLLAAYDAGALELTKGLKDRIALLRLFKKVNKTNWVVSIQKALSDAKSIVKYVGRYTKRACMSEYKIESHEQEHITFQYNDYKNTPKGQKPVIGRLRLHYVEFFDRLFQHVPNKRFRCVRYYGVYAQAHKIPADLKAAPADGLDASQLREMIDQLEGDFLAFRSTMLQLTGQDPLWCSYCQRSFDLMGIISYNKQIGQTEVHFFDDS